MQEVKTQYSQKVFLNKDNLYGFINIKLTHDSTYGF